MRVHVLALDGVFDLGLSAVLDAFQTANELAEMSALSGERFDVKIVGVTKSIKTSQGLTVPVQAIGSKAPDCVVVPAIGFKMPERLEVALARPDIQDAAVLLRRWARKGAMMTAACIGTFVMAESGLLDHQRATTTWWLAPADSAERSPCAIRRLERICRHRSIGLIRKMGTDPPAMFSIAEGTARYGLRAR